MLLPLFDRSRPLPVGMSQFETFANRIIAKAGDFADRDSMEYALASILIHADAKHGSLPDSYFVNRLRKSAANQIASQVFQNIKTKQAAELEKQKQAEATATLEAVADEQTKEI